MNRSRPGPLLLPLLLAVIGCDVPPSRASGEGATEREAEPAAEQTSEPPREAEPEPLRVSVARSEGELYLRLVAPDGESAGHRIPTSAELEEIAAVLPDAPGQDAAVVMETGRDVPHEVIVAITDALRLSGWTRVTMRMAPVQ